MDNEQEAAYKGEELLSPQCLYRHDPLCVLLKDTQALGQAITDKQETQSIVAQTRRLTALKQRYDLLYETFPIWPLEIGTLRRIAVTIILPLLLPLLTSLITYCLHLLGIV